MPLRARKTRALAPEEAILALAADMMVEKYCLNLAGEYRVCAELLKRNIFATITYGNMKGANVFAIGPNRRAAVVEVKASNSSRFVTGFYQRYKSRDVVHPNFWVLYSVSPRDRLFVLSHEQLADVQAQRNHCEDLSYDERAKRVEHGVDNVLIQDVEAHEDTWAKIMNGARLRPNSETPCAYLSPLISTRPSGSA